MQENYLRKLVELTKTNSEAVINATIEHLCLGSTQKAAAERYGVKQAAVGRLVTRLMELSLKVEQLNNLRNAEPKKSGDSQ
ncbi:hypothetical protein AB8I23_004270 [Vibrio alginolyticus]|nr:hypothetical protein [Vibrio parahaemolyticus]EJC7127763.1 hypothetical protein [Vibrio parahaemolyticus]